MYDDTIAAISTGSGEAGIGIVRLSGPDSEAILRLLFQPAGHTEGVTVFESHLFYYGHARDCPGGDAIDEVLAVFMRAPRTYTREDVVEIHCHGGAVPVRRVLLAALNSGARLARPGEFTLRAFLNGRIDLSQAESVADVIRSRTDRGLAIAMRGLDGGLSGRVRGIRADLLRALAYLEATIDFSEDDIPFEDVSLPLGESLWAVESLLATADQGIISRLGVRAAIVGRPNAGKSSLLNALLRADRAIVTEIPGTTRDTLEEVANFSGVPVCLVDTAGIAEARDQVERLGIERSRRALDESDLCLFVVDSSEPIRPEDREIAATIGDRPVLVVASKADLPGVSRGEIGQLVPGAPVIETSTSTGEGLERLREAVLEKVLAGGIVQSDELLVSSPRHKEVLYRSARHLRDAIASLASLPPDCTATDVRAALDALGEITGETASADLLETIFSNFCVGK